MAANPTLLVQQRDEGIKRLRARIPEFEETILNSIRHAVTDRTGEEDIQFWLGMRDVTLACLDCCLLAIEQGGAYQGPVPPVVVIQARRAVRNRVGITTAVTRYLIAFQIVFDCLLEEFGGDGVPVECRFELVRQVATAATSLLVQLLAQVVGIHSAELERSKQTTAQREAAAVVRVIAGERPCDREFDYDVTLEHLGLIGHGADAVRAIQATADQLGYRSKVIHHDDGTVWAWLGTCRAIEVGRVEEIILAFADVVVAMGEPVEGLLGFRETHRLAQRALLVGRITGQRSTRYAHVARSANTLADPIYNRWLNDTFITPLTMHPEGDVLLKTLAAYYQAARNAAKAAKLLKGGRSTVTRHLEKVREIIDRPLSLCHTDLEDAVQLAMLYLAAADRGVPDLPAS